MPRLTVIVGVRQSHTLYERIRVQEYSECTVNNKTERSRWRSIGRCRGAAPARQALRRPGPRQDNNNNMCVFINLK